MFTARSACSANANVTPAFIWALKSTFLSALCNRNQHTKVQFCKHFATEISTQKYSSVSALQQKSAHKSTVLSALCNRNQHTKVQFSQRFCNRNSTQKYSSVSDLQQKSAHNSTVLSALCNRNQHKNLYSYVSIVVIFRQFWLSLSLFVLWFTSYYLRLVNEA